jgi:hypothetical protein
MNPRQITQADIEHWADRHPQAASFTAPGEIEEGIEPCPALVLDGDEIAVPWVLDEIEMMHLVKGGTLWLITRGSLPVHGFYVQEPKR